MELEYGAVWETQLRGQQWEQEIHPLSLFRPAAVIYSNVHVLEENKFS